MEYQNIREIGKLIEQKPLLSKSNNPLWNKNIGYRGYSSLASNNSKDFIFNRYYLNNVRFFNTKNSVISNKLLEIIYSSEDKELAQEKIENFLISQQNNTYLEQAKDSNLNFWIIKF